MLSFRSSLGEELWLWYGTGEEKPEQACRSGITALEVRTHMTVTRAAYSLLHMPGGGTQTNASEVRGPVLCCAEHAACCVCGYTCHPTRALCVGDAHIEPCYAQLVLLTMVVEDATASGTVTLHLEASKPHHGEWMSRVWMVNDMAQVYPRYIVSYRITEQHDVLSSEPRCGEG